MSDIFLQEGQTIIEIEGLDLACGDIEKIPCQNLEAARELARQKIRNSGDVAAWCNPKKGGDGIFYNKNATSTNKMSVKECVVLFIKGQPLLK